MIVLLKKELRSFFSSATGYIVIGVFLLITGLFLWVFPGQYNILESGYAQLDGLFTLAPWLYLFLVPAVTMRMFAEEKRNGTLELLYTKPISGLSIVLGKYLAGVFLVIFSLLPTIIYFITVFYIAEPLGNVDSGAFWGSFIGLFFLAAIYVAIGLFSSSITENQIVSFILSLFLCFLFYSGFDLVASLFKSGEIISFIGALGINSHYESMSRGVIDSRDVIYFLSVSSLFLFITNWRICGRIFTKIELGGSSDITVYKISSLILGVVSFIFHLNKVTFTFLIDASFLNILISITIRIISVILCSKIATYQNRNKIIWQISSFIIPSLCLIVLPLLSVIQTKKRTVNLK